MGENIFKFVDGPHTVGSDELVVSLDDAIRSKEQLISSIEIQLGAAEYFGAPCGLNWDALFDVLGTLSWIDKQRITIVHDDVPSLPENELKTYLKLLSDAAQSLGQDGNHLLSVIFPKAAKKSVMVLSTVQI